MSLRSIAASFASIDSVRKWNSAVHRLSPLGQSSGAKRSTTFPSGSFTWAEPAGKRRFGVSVVLTGHVSLELEAEPRVERHGSPHVRNNHTDGVYSRHRVLLS